MSTRVEAIAELNPGDLDDLCSATEAAILEGGGFGWLAPPPRHILEAYWKGVTLVPERTLFVARLDDVIGGSAQLIRPSRNNEATDFAAGLTTFFLAPWSRGHGLAKMLVEAVEAVATEEKFLQLNLDVRETQEQAIKLYESLGYDRWGSNPRYARVGGKTIAGHFYSKQLNGGLEGKHT